MDKDFVLIIKHNCYVIYNYVRKQILAYALIRNVRGYVEVNFVAAEHGLGPLIHDIIMMDNFPLEVRSDTDLTIEEINIWKYYFEKRKDVNKYKIHKNYEKIKKYGEESLLYAYKLKPTKEFLNFKKKSKEVIFEYKINEDYLINEGETFFDDKYNSRWDKIIK